MTICELTETPAFQNTVTDLTVLAPEIADKANDEVIRDFLEQRGKLRDAEEIYRKLYSAPFSMVKAKQDVQFAGNADEIILSKKEKLQDLGYKGGSMKTWLSDEQIRIMQGRASKLNNELKSKGVKKMYKVNRLQQQGQSDNFKWEIRVYPANINTQEKLDRLQNSDYDTLAVPRHITRGTQTIVEERQPDTQLDSYYAKENYAQEIVRALANALGQQVGVDYAFIEPHQALELTKNAKNPWKGESSFFFGGKVYFIAGNLKPGDVLHEFVHPIIRNIAKESPSLFDQLFDQLAATNDGAGIIEEVKNLYPELGESDVDFKEECLVRAIEKDHALNSKGLQINSAFAKFVNNLLYTIKQRLREIFGGKVKVSELSPNTTLQEISQMLKDGKSFELNPELVSDEELVAYKREYDKIMEDFNAANADKAQIEKVVNDYFDTVSRHLKNATERQDLGELVDIMQNQYKTGELQKMKQNLKSYQTLIVQDAKVIDDQVELVRQRVQAVVNSLSNVDNMVSNIVGQLQEMVKDIDDPDNVQRVLYLQKTLKYWGDFVNNVNNALESNGVRGISMVDRVNAGVRRANELMESFYEKASEGVLWETLKGAAENIDAKWDARIKQLKAKNAPQTEIDKAIKDAAAEKITPEAIRKALKGHLKDLNFANAYLEGYGYSPDPVVGGLALFVKNQLAKTEAGAQAKFNDAAQTLKPLLDKVGYNPNKPGQIGEELGQKEKVGRVNPETGEFEEVEVWRFLNEFSGADLARDKALFAIKQASAKYQESGTAEDKQKLADLQADWEQTRRDYYNAEYTEEFYKVYDILKKDAIGAQARMTMNNLYDELGQLSGQLARATSEDVLELIDLMDAKRREIKQLSSSYDVAGNLKTGDDLEIALRLQKFNEAAQGLYDSVEIPGAFEGAYNTYAQKLRDEGKKEGTFAFDDAMAKWLEKNTRVAIKEEFWEKMDLISEAIKDILSRLPKQDALNLEIEESYKIIKDMVKGNRDEGGQPLGSELSPEKQQIIKDAQERINKARESLTRISGLTKQEQNTMDAIFAKLELPGGKITQKDSLILSRLLDKSNSLRLSKIERMELNSLFNELNELRTKEATDSYVDTVNSFLDAMPPEAVDNALGTMFIDKATANYLSDEDSVQKLFDASPEFEEWFLRNHTRKESVNMETNEVKYVWERTYAWNVIRPIDKEYYYTTKVNTPQGEKEIDGLPSMNYYKRLVKDEYKTKKIEGVTVDNRGYWLPKTMAQGAKDDRYINKEYARMRTQDPDKFKLLEEMRRIHLKNQDGLGKRAKLYLDYPRYRKQLTERLQSEGVIDRILQRFKDFWSKVKDGWDNGFNFDDNMQLVKMDLFDDGITGVPIAGTSNLAIEEVSTDVVYTTMRYMLSAERNRNLSEIAPVARMIQNVVNNEKNYPLESKLLQNGTLINPSKKKAKYVRARAVNNFIEKQFEGVVNTGWGSDNATAQNISKFIFGRASSAFLDLNIPSALKNILGMKFQGMIEASAGKYMNWKDFTAAEVAASETTFKIMAEIYQQGPKSWDVQLVEIFDPERDRFMHHFGESMTRTPGKDYSYLILQRMNDFRRTTQLQAAIQGLFGMMKHQIIPTTDGKNIKYFDAWELKDGKIQLKPNVDPTWGITYTPEGEQKLGAKFLQKRNEYQRALDNMNGAMSKEDSPEAERYLAFRYVSFFRRFLTAMLMNRFAKNRVDYQLGDFKEGFYWTFLKLMGNSFKTLGRNLPNMNATEKQAVFRVMTEAGTILLMKYLLLATILGFDDDDEDRYAKLRKNSDALPLWFVHDDPSREFNMAGWLKNHAILQTMQISAENSQFYPFPGWGLNNYKDFFNLKSMAMGPTINTYLDIVGDAYYMATGNEKAKYQRDASAYDWGRQGDYKLWNHVGKSFGFTSSTVEPAIAVRNFQNIQSR